MKLSDVVNRINGNVDRFTTDLEYYVGGEHFDSNELAVTRKGMLKENLNVLGFKFHFAFQKRDVLFMARNPHLRKAGMVMFDGLCSDATYILRSKDENVLLQEYLALQLQSDHFWNYCESHKVGSVNFANNWTSIANYEFELPSIEEQKVLADKLWAAYKVKESYRQLLSTTDEMLKAKFQEMFGEVDEYKSLCEICRPKQWPTIPTKDFTDEGYLVYGANGVIGHYTEYNHEFPTILMACRGASCGAINVSQPKSYITGNAMCLDDIDFDVVTFHYLEYFLSRHDYIGIITGGAQPQITYANLCKLMVPIPPIEEQKRFDEIYTQAEATKASLRASIEAIDRVIKSLINQ